MLVLYENIKCLLFKELVPLGLYGWWQIPSFFLYALLCVKALAVVRKYFTIKAETFLVVPGVWFICQTSKEACEFRAKI